MFVVEIYQTALATDVFTRHAHLVCTIRKASTCQGWMDTELLESKLKSVALKAMSQTLLGHGQLPTKIFQCGKHSIVLHILTGISEALRI